MLERKCLEGETLGREKAYTEWYPSPELHMKANSRGGTQGRREAGCLRQTLCQQKKTAEMLNREAVPYSAHYRRAFTPGFFFSSLSLSYCLTEQQEFDLRLELRVLIARGTEAVSPHLCNIKKDKKEGSVEVGAGRGIGGPECGCMTQLSTCVYILLQRTEDMLRVISTAQQTCHGVTVHFNWLQRNH